MMAMNRNTDAQGVHFWRGEIIRHYVAATTDRFYCPFQKTQGFTFEVCLGCKYIDIRIGKKTTIRCRKNKRTPEKRSFENAFLSNYQGHPWQVEIIEEVKK